MIQHRAEAVERDLGMTGPAIENWEQIWIRVTDENVAERGVIRSIAIDPLGELFAQANG